MNTPNVRTADEATPAMAVTAPFSRPARWMGRILSALVILFMLFDGAIKLVPWPIVTETMDRMGYGSSESLARGLGAISLFCTVLHAVPPTSILGAILLTGYLARRDGVACADRRPAVQPHSARILSWPDGVGRVLVDDRKSHALTPLRN